MKILFLIHDLGQGGAEKVLVNLVNNMDKQKFDISVLALFGGGVNEQFLLPHIRYRYIFSKEFPGNSKVMKVLSPEILHSLFVKEKYDIEISYLEGPAARIVSGCKNSDTKLVSWIHCEQHDMKTLASAFRNPKEAIACYSRFHQTVCVSNSVKEDYSKITKINQPCCVLYNTVESDKILTASKEYCDEIEDTSFNLVAVGSLKESKGYMRMLSAFEKLYQKYSHLKLYILGIGPQEKQLRTYVNEHHLENAVCFLGYKTNPYKYVKRCDLLVCASFAEGFSTAVTEALIVGTPVCTVEVSGMRELLGDSEYGLITDNDENALMEGVERLIMNENEYNHYKQKAVERGYMFHTRYTVTAVENMVLTL